MIEHNSSALISHADTLRCTPLVFLCRARPDRTLYVNTLCDGRIGSEEMSSVCDASWSKRSEVNLHHGLMACK